MDRIAGQVFSVYKPMLLGLWVDSPTFIDLGANKLKVFLAPSGLPNACDDIQGKRAPQCLLARHGLLDLDKV